MCVYTPGGTAAHGTAGQRWRGLWAARPGGYSRRLANDSDVATIPTPEKTGTIEQNQTGEAWADWHRDPAAQGGRGGQ